MQTYTMSVAGDYLLLRLTSATGKKSYHMIDARHFGQPEGIIWTKYDAQDAWNEWTRRFQASVALSNLRAVIEPEG